MKFKKKIVFLNGPPSSGKDEIAKLMAIRYDFKHMKFADIIKDITCAALSINRLELEERKEQKLEVLGATIRAFLIWLSEECFKPKYGDDIFGRFMAMKTLNTIYDRIIFSDSGFFSEFYPVAYANIGGQNLVLEVHRPGYDYSQDSRSYWYEPHRSDARRLASHGIIQNDGTLAALRAKASRKICKELGIEWVEAYSPM